MQRLRLADGRVLFGERERKKREKRNKKGFFRIIRLFRSGGTMGNYLDKIRHLHSKGPDEGSLPQSPEPIVIDPAAENPRPIYWVRTGSIVGPGAPEFLAKVGDGRKASYWVVAQFEGGPVWINSIMLRSKREFDCQVPRKPFERIREPVLDVVPHTVDGDSGAAHHGRKEKRHEHQDGERSSGEKR